MRLRLEAGSDMRQTMLLKCEADPRQASCNEALLRPEAAIETNLPSWSCPSVEQAKFGVMATYKLPTMHRRTAYTGWFYHQRYYNYFVRCQCVK